MLSAKKMIGFLVSSTRLPILLVMFVLALSVGGALYFFSAKLGFSGPAIRNVDIRSVTPESATITWKSDGPGDSVVEYGTIRALLPATADGNQVVTTGRRIRFNNSVRLYRLSENTTYFFKVSSTNWEGTTTDDNHGSLYSFTTAAVGDLTFSNIQVIDITATSASVMWETDVPSYAAVERNIQPIYFQCPPTTYNPQSDPFYCTVWDPHTPPTTNSLVRLAELQPETEYHFRVRGGPEVGGYYYFQISPVSFTTLPSIGEVIDLQINSSDDDAHEVPGALPSYSHTDPTILAGSTAAPITDGWRWEGLAIPAGSTITEAWVELHQNRRGRGFVSLLSLEDSPNPASFSAASTPPDRWKTRTQWEIRWSWPHTKVVPGTITTASLVNGVQELVDNYGGINSIVFLERGVEAASNLTNEWSAYDLDPSLSARLHIQFIGPSDTTVPIISAD